MNNSDMIKIAGLENRYLHLMEFPDQIWLSVSVPGASASALFTKESIAELIIILQAAIS